MRLWLDPARAASRAAHRLRRGARRCASRTCRWRRARWGSRPRRAGQTFQISVRAVGRLTRARTSSRTSSSRRRRTARSYASGTWAGSSWARRTTARTCSSTARTRWASASPSSRTPTRSRSTAPPSPSSTASPSASRPGMKYRLAFDTTDVVSESIHDVLFTLVGAIVLVILVIFVFLEDWRTHAHPGGDHPRLAHRHLRVREAARLLDQHADAVRHHPRHRARGGRRDRGHREHRAAHRARGSATPARPPPRP